MPNSIPEIDVRIIPPSQRHPAIFGMLASLTPGKAMQVTSDHDPRPLRYQITTRFPDEFEWEYIAEGPEVWKVRISRAESSGCECCCGH